MRQRLVQTVRIARRVVPTLFAVAGIVVLAPVAAGADAGWSRAPGSGPPGATIRVASSATTLCQWEQPTMPDPPGPAGLPGPATSAPADPPTAGGDAPAPAVAAAAPSNAPTSTTYDGTSVLLRLERPGVAVALRSVPVTAGGAWSGQFVVPPASDVPAGNYDLIARCIVDRPELDGVRSYDFDPLPFTVVEGPPPTTTPTMVPTDIGNPTTVVNPGSAEVQGTQTVRRATANRTATPATLPKTGDGTLAVALAGLAAIVLGAGALWWGARSTRSASPQPFE